MADDEFTLRRAMDRAAKARVITENEMVVEAFETLERSYINTWIETPVRDKKAREMLWLALTGLRGVQRHFETVLTDGKIASQQLAFMDAEQERQKRT